jgi:molybdate transport system permease protein
MLFVLGLPVLGLLAGASPSQWLSAWGHPLLLPALGLSLKTSLITILLVVALGTPLAWWLAQRRRSPFWQWVVDVPMVLPPAVIGLALLVVFSPSSGWGLGEGLVFSTTAVVLAQTIVSAPFYIAAATAAFGAVDDDMIWVARSLGQNAQGAFFRVVLPTAMPGLLAGLGMAWARALGEFGATLFVAGNLPGVSQTMPLAIYTVMESSLPAALSFALVLVSLALSALLVLRVLLRGREKA